MRFAVRTNVVLLWLTGAAGKAGMTPPAPPGNTSPAPGGMTGTVDRTARACLAEIYRTHGNPILEDQT